MVAITVILAAVIAAFVLDLGGSVGEEAQAGVSIEVDESAESVTVEVTSSGNSDYVDFRSSEFGSSEENVSGMTVGDSETLVNGTSEDFQNSTGTVTAVAVIEADGTETQVGSESWNFDN